MRPDGVAYWSEIADLGQTDEPLVLTHHAVEVDVFRRWYALRLQVFQSATGTGAY